MSVAIPDRPPHWRLSFAVIFALHVAAIALALHWLRAADPAQLAPPPAVMIDLPPMPAPRRAPPRPPAPKHEVVHPRPPDPVRQPVAPRAPVAHVAVPLPPKAIAKPPQRIAQAEPAKPVPDNQPPEPAAPPQAEAPAAPPAAVAAPASAAPVAAAPASNAVPTWQGLLLGRLERFKRYPSAAQFRRQQGVAYLRFSMDRHGKVVSASIDKSSGFDTLDQETLALIHRAEPLPPPPPEMPGDPVELVVPIQFFLKPGS